MKILKLAAAVTILALPIASLPAPASAASAHNSQAGGFGQSQNATDSTVSSHRVKHMAKHKRM